MCALDAAGQILDEDQIGPDALRDWILRWRGDRSVLAVDGPLVVRSDSGALRPVERELHRRYGRFHAGPFPGGASSRAMAGRDRSPGQRLIDLAGSYSVDPTDRTSPHRAIEVFPAPTWIDLFGLTKRVIYKRGSLLNRRIGLTGIRALLDSLGTHEPSLRTLDSDGITERMASAVSARDWKAIEDILDARLCAYVALLWDRRGTDDWIVVGSGRWTDGYVVIPRRK